MFNFGGSSKIRFDGYYYCKDHQVRGEWEIARDFLRFYRDGLCRMHRSSSNDMGTILWYLDQSSSTPPPPSCLDFAGTFSMNQGDIFIKLQSDDGKDRENYEGIVLSNGSLKTNWIKTTSYSRDQWHCSGLYFSFQSHYWLNR